jgi:hypothetical protein
MGNLLDLGISTNKIMAEENFQHFVAKLLIKILQGDNKIQEINVGYLMQIIRKELKGSARFIEASVPQYIYKSSE